MPDPILKRPDDIGMAEAFARDGFLERKFRDLVAQHGIQTIIETGTWRGYTARRMAEFAPYVCTIENDPKLFDMACETMDGVTNVDLFSGDSRACLPSLVRISNKPVLYYLDAHWGEDWPLLDELDLIARLDPGPAIIVIHDIKVPGKDFKFDSYHGVDLTFELVKPHLDKLQFRWEHSFNSEAEGHCVGALFVTPI